MEVDISEFIRQIELMNAGLIGFILGIFVVIGIALIIQWNRTLSIKRYLQEISHVKQKAIEEDIKGLRTILEHIAEETNCSYFKSQYNDLIRLISFIKRKFIP